MKFINCFIVLQLSLSVCYSQPIDTIRIYDYESSPDSWRLETKSDHTFKLLSKSISDNNKAIFSGKYQNSDTSIAFFYDTATLKTHYQISEDLASYSNIPLIARGHTFTRKKNYFIPVRISRTDAGILPDNPYGTFYRGDGFNSHILEIMKNHKYRFSQHTCMDKSFEEGTWVINNNIIKLIPNNKQWTTIDWLTSNKQFLIEKNFLIGKKTSKDSKTKRITETYDYLPKDAL
jgi:hypothetical protein